MTEGPNTIEPGNHDDGQYTPEFVLETHTIGRVNFASAQNDVGAVRKLTRKNNTQESLDDLTITLTANPPVIREKTWKIDRLAPESEITIRDLSTPLDIGRLAGLNEAEIGELRFVVDSPDGRLAEEHRRLELLARDEWGGVGDMAQILAAFVSPNDAVVAAILKEASVLLERAGKDGSIDGYQTKDPGRAWLLAGAIWSAVTGLGLSYAMPPASFEREGHTLQGARTKLAYFCSGPLAGFYAAVDSHFSQMVEIRLSTNPKRHCKPKNSIQTFSSRPNTIPFCRN